MCDHERLRTVGNRVFCCECGDELPLEFLLNNGKPKEAPVQAVEQAENAVQEQEQEKPRPRKRTAKKAV